MSIDADHAVAAAVVAAHRPSARAACRAAAAVDAPLGASCLGVGAAWAASAVDGLRDGRLLRGVDPGDGRRRRGSGCTGAGAGRAGRRGRCVARLGCSSARLRGMVGSSAALPGPRANIYAPIATPLRRARRPRRSRSTVRAAGGLRPSACAGARIASISSRIVAKRSRATSPSPSRLDAHRLRQTGGGLQAVANRPRCARRTRSGTAARRSSSSHAIVAHAN